jgi:hypothetical protein
MDDQLRRCEAICDLSGKRIRHGFPMKRYGTQPATEKAYYEEPDEAEQP